MAYDFSGTAGAASAFDIIPNGQLAFAVLTVRGVKASASGGGYLDCELVIDEGQPYAGRKVWDMIGDPNNPGNSEKYCQMGAIAITRILEAGRGAGPNNLAAYLVDNYEQLSGLRVPIKLGVETGTGGHDDKNRVAEYLTPNPASQSGHKLFVKLQAGEFNANAPAAPMAANGFGNVALPGGIPPITATTGFKAPQPNFPIAATAGDQSAQASSPQATAPATAASSPSNPGATPGWLEQATPAS